MARTTVAVDTATRDQLRELADQIGRDADPPRRNVSYDEVIRIMMARYKKQARKGARK